jgi:hypothetical protein
MQFLTDAAWLDLTKDLKMETEEDMRHAMHFVRFSAKTDTATRIQQALNAYSKANEGKLPNDASQLKPFLNMPDADTILQRYRIIVEDKPRQAWLNGMFLVEKVAVDKWSEPQIAIGLQQISAAPAERVHLTFPPELKAAMESYRARNSSQVPTNFDDLRPYLNTPEQQAALDKLIKALTDR